MSEPTMPVLPARPLVDAIDRLIWWETNGDPTVPGGSQAVLDRIGVDSRKMFEWRNRPRCNVQVATADRVLCEMPFLWFDVWPACNVHEARESDCGMCDAHYRARWAFTGEPEPRRQQRSAA